MEGARGSVFLFLLLGLISSTDSSNTSPTIQESVYQFCEDVPKGSVAFTINATDADNDPLTYRLEGPNAGFFNEPLSNGSVTVRTSLDGDIVPTIAVNLFVSDGFTTVSKPLTLILGNANDNKPIFLQSSYDVEVPENTTPEKSLFQVQANDLDSGAAGIPSYSIDEINPSSGSSLFSINSKTGVVSLTSSLNYSTMASSFRLKINATDGGGKCFYPYINYQSSVVFSFITLKDVPDLDPEFTGLPYRTNVKEHADSGLSVFTVTAIDNDRGINDDIHYTIANTTVEGLFQISPDSGVITVSGVIDREVIGDTVYLTIKGTEAQENIHGVFASATATVEINIIDINDKRPEFYKCGTSCVKDNQFTGEVNEHSLEPILINMTVRDDDQFPVTRLTVEGRDKEVFYVSPSITNQESVVQLTVKQQQLLDYETTQQMEVNVIATDGQDPTLQSTATVTIIIKDVNDHSPKFANVTYSLQVAEHSPDGTIIANITAEDPDTMDQNKLQYRLIPDSMLEYFTVNEQTGIVSVKSSTLLDREVRSLYSVTLQATDTDGKPGITVLEITVTDINDNKPVIIRDSYEVFVKEGGKVDLKIEATDADDPDTENSQIEYEIVPSDYSSLFTINPNTGVLRNTKDLDREAIQLDLDGAIQLEVKATDKGTPPLSDTVPVTINVEDINDNTPIFEQTSYSFSVEEGQRGVFVGSVFAEDSDQTSNHNRISFTIRDGNAGNFIITSDLENPGYRGRISVDPDIELEYEGDRKTFDLLVEAKDLGDRSAEVMVRVDVLDVNDERPEFIPIEQVTVKENTTYGEPIGRFIASDKDGNHSLVYQLESMTCRCNNSMEPCHNFVLDPTGEVRVNSEPKLDYEECDMAVIQAQVVDVYTQKGENNSAKAGEMIINIQDINDNAPEFIPSSAVDVVVSETASIATSVASVTARDRDSGERGDIKFAVTGVEFRDINDQTNPMPIVFEAYHAQEGDIYRGIIQPTQKLDVTLKGTYLVTVRATDGELSTSTVLDIFIVDSSYRVEIEFRFSVEEVKQRETEIRKSLMDATNAGLQIVAIRQAGETTRAVNTIMEAYFVYSNGTALTSKEVEEKISHPDHYLQLIDLGLTNIGAAPVIPPQNDPVKFAMFGIVACLVVVLAVLTTSLLCTRRKFRTKLKAAKARNSASMVNSDDQKSGPVVPGTNKYTMEGANPVLNLNIDSVMIMDLDGESSDDKASLNSLDYNYESVIPDKETRNIMLMEEDERESNPPEYIEALGEALAQRGQKKGSDSPQDFVNPAFSTTDL